MNLVVFDFDGTLTTKDSLLEFLKYHQGPVKTWYKLLLISPVLLLYLLRIMPNWRAKELLLSFFLKGIPADEFQVVCNNFSQQVIPQILRQEAYGKMMHHRRQGDKVVVISASPENWLFWWCENQGVELLATKLQTQKGKITGKINGLNCYGPEKVRRLKEHLNLANYHKVYVYGDSRGDKELLALASNPFYRKF